MLNQSLDALVQAVYSGDPQTRAAAALALREHEAADVASHLANLLMDPNAQVREAACASLIYLGTPACPSVIPMLSNPKQHTRELAALVMRWVSDEHGVPALLAALGDESATVRNQAARALGRLRDKTAIPSLEALRRTDPNNRIRQTAEISLRKLGATPNS